MASSTVMPTSSSTSTTTISDLPSSLNYFHLNHNYTPNRLINHNYTPNHSQMIPNFTDSNQTLPSDVSLFPTDGEITMIDAAGAISAVECPDAATIRRKTAEDVWRDIVDGGTKECKLEEAVAEVEAEEMMTLEDFLARATAEEVEEGGVKAEIAAGGGVYPMAMAMAVTVVGGGGRGKRGRGGSGSGGVVVMESLDKASQQRQRRMIKNRESAARSRERKQAYQVELEALAAKLEEENELLLKEKADRTKQRYQQLMEKIVPVVEKRRMPRTLRRVRSMQW